MMARRLALLVVLYVGADLSNPFMPGAFRFSADESVEVPGVTRAARRAAVIASNRVKVDPPEPSRPSYLPSPERGAGAPTASLGEWFVDLRRAHTPFHEPPSAADDH